MDSQKTDGGTAASSGGGTRWFTSYLLSNIAAGLISPLIPLYVILYLKSNVFYVGLVSSLASAASVPALIFWGNLSDSVGKRKIFILVGFFGSFLTLLQILIVRDITGYVIMLVSFQALAMAAVPVSTLLILETRMEPEWPQVMSTFSMISAVGTVIGLLSGSAVIVYWHYADVLPAMYLIASLVYLSAAISAVLLLPEPGRQLFRTRLHKIFTFRIIERGRHFPSYVLHIIPFGRNKGESRAFSLTMKKYLFTTTFLMFGFQIFFVPFPVFIINYLHASDSQVFILYLLNSVLSMFTFRIAGILVRRKGIRKTLSLGILPRVAIFASAGVLPFLASLGPGILVVSIILYGVLGALWSLISIGEVTSVSRLAVKVNRGKAIGYYNSLLGVGQIGGASISGIIALDLGYTVDFLIAAAVVLAGSYMILRFYPDERRVSGSRPDREITN